MNIVWNIYIKLFWLETSKNYHSRVCECPCPQVKVPFYIPKNPFYSHNCPFIFQRCPFVSWNCCFAFQKCLFYFSKIFPTDCTFSSSCSEPFREIIFALLLFCFLFELFIGQLMMPCILLVFTFKQ